MKLPTITIPDRVREFSGVFYFVFILMVSNLFWKWTVMGTDTDTIVTFFDYDITGPFVWMADHIAKISITVLKLFNHSTVLEPGNIIRNDNGYAVQVVWSCSGIKQAYILTSIIVFYRGPWMQKLWYIPFGIMCVILFNQFRVISIIALIQYNPEWFDFLHEQFFKYLFYTMIFGLWVYWEERIRPKKIKKTETVEISE